MKILNVKLPRDENIVGS